MTTYLLAAYRRRRAMALGHEQDEAGFALVLSLLFILVITSVSLAMAAVIINQAKPTQEARKLLQTVNAAQSGLQVALAAVRGANDSAGNGLLYKLPCSSGAASFAAGTGGARTAAAGARYTGAVSPGSGSAAYEVSMSYFLLDPKGQPPAWLTSNAMPCPLTQVPNFAYLQSFGTGAKIVGSTTTQGSRSQIATYKFKTSNINSVGGRLRSYGTQQCVDAGTSPAVGTTLTLQPCLALGTVRQTWQYRKDLSLFYGGDTTLNLCIQAPTSGNRAVLVACTGSGLGTTYPYASGQQVQEWGFNDNGHFSAARDDGSVTNGTGGSCLQPEGASGSTAAASGAFLVTVSCDGNTTGPAAFDPDPQVGAGKAGGGTDGVPGATRQYVNYAQFGRCLDITGQDVNADHLIAYPCKQAPDSSQLTFNQVWDYAPDASGSGSFSVTKLGVRFCLTAPVSGDLVTTKACLNGLPSNQRWRATGNRAQDYPGSYNLVSASSSNCLAVSPLSEALSNGSSNIVTVACNGSNAQKWNAPPVEPNSRLGNIQETVGG